MNYIGKNIKKHREAAGMNQDYVAEKLNVTRQAVSNWERGVTEPDIDTLNNLACLFNITLEELIYSKKEGFFVEKRAAGVAKAGISFGSCLAMIISYTAFKSIGWAIFHGLLGWFYVIYYIIKY